jgi:hypothetical protein
MGRTIVQALKDKKLFGNLFTGPTWQPWHTVLRASFALPPAEGDLERFTQHTGRTTWPTVPAKEFWVIAGRRSGKAASPA